MSHVRQSRPNSGLGFQVEDIKTCELVLSSPRNDWEGGEAAEVSWSPMWGRVPVTPSVRELGILFDAEHVTSTNTQRWGNATGGGVSRAPLASGP